MDLFGTIRWCGLRHPFRAGGHVPEFAGGAATPPEFLDLNGKDLALDRERTERLTYALGRELDIPRGVRQRHPPGGAVRLRHHGL